MVISLVKGGLGNQMFQYAAGKALAAHLGVGLKIDLSYLIENAEQVDVFVARPYELHLFPHIQEAIVHETSTHKRNFFQRFRRAITGNSIRIYKEQSMAFDPLFFSIKAPVLLDGFFQSQNYFLSNEKIIRESFEFPDLGADDPNKRILQEIEHCISVSVHVRRGDYLNNLILQHHGVCSKDYYTKAIKKIKEQYAQAKFYFFSDDPAWVKQELISMVEDYCIVEGNTGTNAWKDMLLMSYCKHQIVANSSFSWWGAWLNRNPAKTVIAPKYWFANKELQEQTANICPSAWVRI